MPYLQSCRLPDFFTPNNVACISSSITSRIREFYPIKCVVIPREDIIRYMRFEYDSINRPVTVETLNESVIDRLVREFRNEQMKSTNLDEWYKVLADPAELCRNSQTKFALPIKPKTRRPFIVQTTY